MSGDAIRMVDIENKGEARSSALSSGAPRINSALLGSVRVALTARLGEADMTVDGIMGLKAGAVVTLGTGLADHVDLYLNDTLVARGEVVAVGDKYGVRIIDIVSKP